MGDNNKQHYVQQSYLRRFSVDRKQICGFDKVLNKAFQNGIKNVAQESHFYRLPDGLTDEHGSPVELDPLLVEKWFQNVEGGFSKDIQTLVDLPAHECISPTIRESLAEHIAIQYLRTRAFRNIIVDTGEQLTAKLLEEAIRVNFGEDHVKYAPKVTYDEKAAGLMQMQNILNDERVTELSNILQGHIWTILINETEHTFYTSDAPVVLHNHLDPPRFRPGLGLGSTGIEIALPLSSRRLLSIRDRKALSSDADKYENRTQLVSPENVEFYNSLQVIGCERQVYCEKDEWGLVEEMIRENPRLSEIKSRVTVN